jgi:hypothetical protein
VNCDQDVHAGSSESPRDAEGQLEDDEVDMNNFRDQNCQYMHYLLEGCSFVLSVLVWTKCVYELFVPPPLFLKNRIKQLLDKTCTGQCVNLFGRNACINCCNALKLRIPNSNRPHCDFVQAVLACAQGHPAY